MMINHDEFCKHFYTPLDFDQLIADGILRATSKKNWYQLLGRLNDLPPEAEAKCEGVKIIPMQNGSKKILLRFADLKKTFHPQS